MLATVVETAFLVLGVYLALGMIAATTLHLGGLRSIDPATSGTGISFRILITPGLIALWPILILRWRAARGGAVPPLDQDRPVGPRQIRRGQSLLLRSVAGVAALGFVLAMASRPPLSGRGDDLPLPADPPPIAGVASELGDLFGDLEIGGVLRRDAGGKRQLELSVARDLLIPTLALYWSPAGSHDESGLGSGAILIGTVWGPGIRRYPLPTAVSGDGELVLFSIARGEVIDTAKIPWKGE